MSRFDIGNGSIWLGDCLELMREIPDGSVDLVVTDPPYRVISGGNTGPAGRKYGWDTSVLHKNDSKIFKHNDVKLADYVGEIARVLKDGGHCYIMTNRITLLELLTAAKSLKLSFANILFWGKGRKNPNKMYMLETEITCMFYKKPCVQINDCGESQIFFCPVVGGKNKSHPTEKPVELMQHYIENSSQPGDLILDPFSGSGATAVAAQRSGRRWIAIEKDPEYYIKSVGRLCGEVEA